LAKKKKQLFDGITDADYGALTRDLRRRWSWSAPRRIAKERSVAIDGFHRCEQCRRKTPKIFIDHIVPIGSLKHDGAGWIERLYCPSIGLQALCKICHDQKTKAENRKRLESKK
jgi:5-methylcytosine-specific restriction endonuclease McrA